MVNFGRYNIYIQYTHIETKYMLYMMNIGKWNMITSVTIATMRIMNGFNITIQRQEIITIKTLEREGSRGLNQMVLSLIMDKVNKNCVSE